MERHTTSQMGTTQIYASPLSVILAVFIGYLAVNNQELENYLWLEFFETENSTVHSCFSVDYS
ncbi:MAG: hypothetical protein ABJE79_09040 [Marinomonas sp.]